MANAVEQQILLDGPGLHIVKVTGRLDTSDLSATTIVDVSALVGVGNHNACTVVSIRQIDFQVEDGLEVRLWWDATTDVIAAILLGRDRLCPPVPLVNNSGTGKTGDIVMTTQGWGSGLTLAFTITLECIKS